MIFGSDDVNSVMEEGEVVFGMGACDVGWDRGEVGDEDESVHEEESCTVKVVRLVIGSFELAKESFLFFGWDGIGEIVVLVERVGVHAFAGSCTAARLQC